MECRQQQQQEEVYIGERRDGMGWDGYVDDPVLRELDRQQTETGNLYTCVFSFCFTNPAWNVEQTVIVSK